IYAAPKLVQGAYAAGGFVSDATPGDDWSLRDNTWPPASDRAWPSAVVGKIGDDWLTAVQWDSLPIARGDRVRAVDLPDLHDESEADDVE
ncbi:MAG: hypothetical protein AAGK78_03230, partial [Planctomycetota bacterium]